MNWLMFLVAAVLIVIGAAAIARARDKQHSAWANGAGMRQREIEEAYSTYRNNRMLAGYLAIWVGIGLIFGSIWFPFKRGLSLI